MYFNKNNKFYHGIMFHHFHDKKKFPISQGSISENQLHKLINKIGRRNFINPEEFLYKLEKNKLKNTDLCLTFDDGLKSQISIAYPVLDDLKLKAFYFVYTSIFNKNYSMLEPYRYFRHYYFKNMTDFYKNFNDEMIKIFNNSNEFNNFKVNCKKKIIEWKVKHPRYSFNDIIFRLTRDFFLKKNQYEKTMNTLFKKKKFNHKKIKKDLFMSVDDLKYLEKKGNIIGLHSHTHPTNLASENFQKQKKEYSLNYKKLNQILKKPIISVSFPNGSYNQETLRILKQMKIKIGFRQVMDKDISKINISNYEIARVNHSQICQKFKIL